MTASTIKVEDFRKSLLIWYNKNRRPLPWRAINGRKANPYNVWLSEIMAQQTTIPAVLPYFLKFIAKWPTVHDLAAASSDDIMQNWAGLGYYARARNLHKCAKYVSEELGGAFPDNQEDLEKLPGIGNYTANAIAAIAFNKPANVVDANVERVMARLFAITEPLPDSKPALKKLAGEIALGETKRPGDYAQSVMELGALICAPTSPKCTVCPVGKFCKARKLGIEADLPARKAKAAKPQKHGYVYWIKDRDGRVLFERRGEKGMLGGMIGLPTSEWVEKAIEKSHLLLTIKPVKSRVVVKHSFTHFDLELSGYTAEMRENNDGQFFWVSEKEVGSLGIPTLFKKAVKQFI